MFLLYQNAFSLFKYKLRRRKELLNENKDSMNSIQLIHLSLTLQQWTVTDQGLLIKEPQVP